VTCTTAGMTIQTTKSDRPDAKSDMAIEQPVTTKTQPGLGVSAAAPEPDLESRIKVRRVEMVAKLRELRTDISLEAAEAGDKIKAKLSELAHIIKEGVVDGWTSIGDNAKHKLDSWLTESARQIAMQLPASAGPAKTGQS
jgi:hypothetical protein